ncbi:hypothetical protein FJTKL_00924 [Diaporthe vaccinii]|uniref:Uncharacterized protein n=1 Tax=Diaporthe vaccinii TaxID=105482 RepID=A0ABR4E1W2_9PEZI
MDCDDCDDSPSWSHLVTVVLKHYHAHALKRGPYGLDQALQQARQADENSTTRIVFDRSEAAWRAYFSADKAAKSSGHFADKAKLKRLLCELSSQPRASQCVFADQLASAMESEGNASAPTCITVEDRTVAAVPSPITPSSAEKHPLEPEHNVLEPKPGHVISAEDNGFGGTHFGAPLKPAQEIFHEQFWDSVQRLPGKEPGIWLADISMLFQQGHIRDHFGCQMGLRKRRWHTLRSSTLV